MKILKYVGITHSTESKIPVLEINLVEKGHDEVLDTVYLCPFRAYSFQVCGTPSGEWDFGASTVIGLANCIITPNHHSGVGYQSNVDFDGQSKELLSGQAAIALISYAHRKGAVIPNPFGLGNDAETYNAFINECFEYVRKYAK